MLAKYHSSPQVFVHDFAISSIVESSLVTSRSNHDGRIMPSNHVQQNPGLHTTLKPSVNIKDILMGFYKAYYGALSYNKVNSCIGLFKMFYPRNDDVSFVKGWV